MAVNESPKSSAKRMRRFFVAALLQQVRILSPIFSGILVIMVGTGFVVGYIENWRMDEALYFTFVTGLTIGYGDLVPKHVLARLLALLIGLSGIVLTGLVAAVAVQALNAADRDLAKQRERSSGS
jgi:hypothetical protein